MMRLTNLLPQDRIKSLTREYYVRLLILALSMAALLIVIHATLLVPAYLFISEEVETRSAHLVEISSLLDGSDEVEVRERISALSKSAEALLALSSMPSVSKILQATLSVPREGVLVTSISFSASESGGGQMQIAGTAPTREALRRYHAALSDLPFVTHADLPLSVYAEETNLPFSITLTGPFTL